MILRGSQMHTSLFEKQMKASTFNETAPSMKRVHAIVDRYALAYTILCFLLSWGSVVACVGWRFPTPDEMEGRLLPIMVAAMLLGPSISGISTNLAKYGVDATMENFRKRGCRWKNRYALSVLFAPSLVGLALALMSVLVSKEAYTPAVITMEKGERASFISIGLAYGVAAGVFEEIGWSLTLVPEMLLQGASTWNTGLTVGLVWGIWHFLVAIYGSGNGNGTFSADLFVPWVPWNLLVLPAYRVLMVYVFEATGSFWPMVLMHGTLTASLPLILMPIRATGLSLASFYALFAAMLWASLFCVALFRDKAKHRCKAKKAKSG